MDYYDRTFVERVLETLNPSGAAWHPLSGSVLLAHLDAYTPLLWVASVPYARDYCFLARFMADALKEHPDEQDFGDLRKQLTLAVTVLNNVAYQALLTGHDREALYLVAEDVEEMLQELKRAPTR